MCERERMIIIPVTKPKSKKSGVELVRPWSRPNHKFKGCILGMERSWEERTKYYCVFLETKSKWKVKSI